MFHLSFPRLAGSVVRFRDYDKFKRVCLTVKDNKMFNPIFGMLSSKAIRNIPDMIGYLMVRVNRD